MHRESCSSHPVLQHAAPSPGIQEGPSDIEGEIRRPVHNHGGVGRQTDRGRPTYKPSGIRDLQNCYECLTAVGATGELQSQSSLVALVRKLPPSTQNRWRGVVYELKEREGRRPGAQRHCQVYRTSSSCGGRSGVWSSQREVQLPRQEPLEVILHRPRGRGLPSV